MEELDVSLNEITPIGIQYLADSLSQSNLKSLNLSKNLLGDESLMIIADAAAQNEGSGLVKLDISSSRIGDNGVLHFLERLDYFENLRVIKVLNLYS